MTTTSVVGAKLLDLEEDPVALEILWGRFISIVDEAWANMMRTSFSVLVREMNDFAIVLTDAQGNSLAQNTITNPLFIGTIPYTVKNVLKTRPAGRWAPGDVLITNDPYIGTGHKNDITIITPVFKDGGLVAFIGNVAHSPDVGGVLMGRSCRNQYEEGLLIPPTLLYRAGEPNETMFDIIAANVRVPDQVFGDLEAQVVGNATGARRVAELMAEVGLSEVDTVAEVLQSRAEKPMREAIRALPDGVYEYQVLEDGRHEPLVFKVAVHIRGDEILVDYTGTSPQQPYGINSAMTYTYP